MQAAEQDALVGLWREIERQGKKPTVRMVCKMARMIGHHFQNDEAFVLLRKFHGTPSAQPRRKPGARRSEKPSLAERDGANPAQPRRKPGTPSRARYNELDVTYPNSDVRKLGKDGKGTRLVRQDRIDAIIAAGDSLANAQDQERKTSKMSDETFALFSEWLEHLLVNPGGAHNVYAVANAKASRGDKPPGRKPRTPYSGDLKQFGATYECRVCLASYTYGEDGGHNCPLLGVTGNYGPDRRVEAVAT